MIDLTTPLFLIQAVAVLIAIIGVIVICTTTAAQLVSLVAFVQQKPKGAPAVRKEREPEPAQINSSHGNDHCAACPGEPGHQFVPRRGQGAEQLAQLEAEVFAPITIETVLNDPDWTNLPNRKERL